MGKAGVRNIRILAGVVGDVTGDSPIVVDYCSGYEINCIISDGETDDAVYRATANSRNDNSRAMRHDFGPPNHKEGLNLQRPALYLNPNPLMDGMRWGCDNATLGHTSIAAETTIVRSGPSSLKITAVNTGTSNLTQLEFNDPWVARICAKGTGFTVGAWVWVPDTPGMSADDPRTTEDTKACTFGGATTVVTAVGHVFEINDPVRFTSTTALPVELTIGTTYYVVATVATDVFAVSATIGGAAITFTDNGTGTHTVVPIRYGPRVGLRTADAGTTTDTVVSSPTARRNRWNFMHAYQIPQTDGIELQVLLYPNQSSEVVPASGEVYMVVDELYVAEGDCWERMMEGHVERSSDCSGTFYGGIMNIRTTQAIAGTIIADTTQIFKDGDTIYYSDVAAAGVPGVVCTTPGAGGTAVFSNMAALA